MRLNEIGEHDIYVNTDVNLPEQICDRNGEVVLQMCKKCGKAESELSDSSTCNM